MIAPNSKGLLDGAASDKNQGKHSQGDHDLQYADHKSAGAHTLEAAERKFQTNRKQQQGDTQFSDVLHRGLVEHHRPQDSASQQITDDGTLIESLGQGPQQECQTQQQPNFH